MEASALRHSAQTTGLVGRSPLLRLQSDEKLIALVRRGHHGAFEALVQRYQSRLLAFCRHMLASTEDAEDVLQEVFAAAFNAMLADDRPINARPWLYRIARNRCLNHLRRPTAAGQDSMDVFERDGGATTADTVHDREEFRQIVADVQELPETQRTALLLREIDALSYEQIAEAMETTVPSVKSLLVRARVSLAEAAEARLLTCEEVREELAAVAEGIQRTTAPARRHLKGCDRCRRFRGELRSTSRALAAIYPIGPLVIVKKLILAKLSAGAGGATATGAGTTAAGAGGATIGGATLASGVAGGTLSAGASAVASKAVAGLAAAAIVTAGAVEVRKATPAVHAPAVAAAAAPGAAPAAAAAPDPTAPVAGAPQPERVLPPAESAPAEESDPAPAEETAAPAAEEPPAATAPVEPVAAPTTPVASEPPVQDPAAAPPVDEQEGTSTLPPQHGDSEPQPGDSDPVAPAPPPSSSPAPADPVAPAEDGDADHQAQQQQQEAGEQPAG